MGQQQGSAPTQRYKYESGLVDTPDAWKCECGATNKGKFCAECGKRARGRLDLRRMRHRKQGKFCTDCGAKKRQARDYRCDKCGWELRKPSNRPSSAPSAETGLTTTIL